MTVRAAHFPTAFDADTSRRPFAIWSGRLLSAIPIAVFLLSAAMKVTHAPELIHLMVGTLGYSEALIPGLAVLEIMCVALYAIPRTAVLGAVLLTGYVGGAIASHLRVGDAFLVPSMLGLLVWGGLYLRDERLRALLPLRTV